MNVSFIAKTKLFFDDVRETFETAINSDLNKSVRTHVNPFCFIVFETQPKVEVICA